MVSHIIVYCFIATLYLLLTLVFQPRIWLHRMPNSVKDSVARQSLQEKRKLLLLGVPWLLFVVSYPIVFSTQFDLTAFQAAKTAATFWFSFILIDTLIVDLVLLCKLQPQLLLIQGTLAQDYDDFIHHIKEGVRGGLLALGSAFWLYVVWP